MAEDKPTHSPLPWDHETVQQRGDCSAYSVIKSDDGKILFDTLNSDVAVIYEEYDEDGVTRWDQTGRTHAALVCRAVNAHASLLAACKAARAYGSHGEIEGGISVSYLLDQAIALAEGTVPT